MSNINSLKSFFKNSNFLNFERQVAEDNNSSLYEDDHNTLVRFINEEIDQSNLKLNDIENYLMSNQNDILKFSKFFLENKKVQSLSLGFTISYSIYLIYLNNKSEKELEDFLKKRRIPNAKKLLEKLLSIKKYMAEV